MSDDDDQYNPKTHKNLLQAISSLGKIQHIKKSTRNEPQKQQDEFQLVKGATAVVDSDRGAPTSVGINDIVQILRTNKKHVDTSKQLRNVHSTKKVLEKPLEKTAADRIKRTIGYENVKKKLVRWDAVVAKNRSADTQVFPLKSESIYVNTSSTTPPIQSSIKSELALELEAADEKLKALKRALRGDTDDPKDLQQKEMIQMKKKLVRDEIIARRKELAYLKMRESQKSAKARMQNKIKSKKYHKLLKRQKMLDQMKEFEILKKKNPEAALEKLNELEKSRVQERASLRHKNTGVWAKNLQVRAKYDKDVRKDLAEQLSISRKLTEKNDDDDSDNEEENDLEKETEATLIEQSDDYDPFNPWFKINEKKESDASNIDDSDVNWRKYWLERNEYENQLKDYCADFEKAKQDIQNGEDESPTITNRMKKPAKRKTKEVQKNSIKNVKKPKIVIENGWVVEEVQPDDDKNIDDIFDAQEDQIRNKLSKKLNQLEKKAEVLKKKPSKTKTKQKKEKDELKNLKDLSFKDQAPRPVIDEPLNHNEEINGNEIKNTESADVVSLANSNGNAKIAFKTSETDFIDPNNLAPIKFIQQSLITSNIDENVEDIDIDEEEFHDNQKLMLYEAFEDDDIIADFNKEKSKDSELKNAELQLSMPGWGSWAGAGIVKDESKSKRLVLKLAPEEKRRDENKEGVYINEDTCKHLRNHLVSNVPFPFTSLQDYEASIRAPIGRNVVPETAFRILTRPSVITHKGQIIEPMDESELVKPDRRLRHIVDKRIAQSSAAVAPIKTK